MGNMPYDVACRHCHREVQTAEQAAARKVEFDALPERLRDEYEEKYQSLDALHQEHRNWWKSSRRGAMLSGGCLTTFAMLFIAPSYSGIVLDFIIGALATRWLFNIKGGAYKGLGIFFLVFLVCNVINRGEGFATRGDMGGAAMGVLAFCFGFLLLMTLGYFLGFKLDDEHGSRSTVA